jgi:hypothetical protein
MAKDKLKESEYKAEGLRRTYIRLNKRTKLWRERGKRGGGSLHNGKHCDSCDGQMTWCSCCHMWSRICCEDYGSCECS